MRCGVTKFEQRWFGDELYISHDVLVKYQKWEHIIKEIKSIVGPIITMAVGAAKAAKAAKAAAGGGGGEAAGGGGGEAAVGEGAAAAAAAITSVAIAGMALLTTLFLLDVKLKDKGHGVIITRYVGVPIPVVRPQPAPQPAPEPNRRRTIRTPETAV